MPNYANMPNFYGLRRNSDQPKAEGFYGMQPVPRTNNMASEYSVGVNMNGKQREIPTFVPGLSGSQMKGLLDAVAQNVMPSKDVMDLAIAHARSRDALGQPTFWRMPEKQYTMPDMPKGLLGDGY